MEAKQQFIEKMQSTIEILGRMVYAAKNDPEFPITHDGEELLEAATLFKDAVNTLAPVLDGKYPALSENK